MTTTKDMVLRNYERGLWSKEMLVKLVNKGVLAVVDYEEIVGAAISGSVCALEDLKNIKLAEVDRWTASKITGGFVSECSGERVQYDSDKDTQLTMQGIALNVNTPLFEQEYPNGCPVRGYTVLGGQDKQVLMLNAEQVLKWCADLSMHIGICKQQGWAKQAEVNACQSVAELDNIILN